MSVGGLFWTQPSGGYERQYSQSKIREGTGRFYQGQIAAPQRRIGSQVISIILNAPAHHAVFLGIRLPGFCAYEGRRGRDRFHRVQPPPGDRRWLRTSRALLKLEGTKTSVLEGKTSTTSIKASTRDDCVRPSSNLALALSVSRVELRTWWRSCLPPQRHRSGSPFP